jgi:hypothetical protein
MLIELTPHALIELEQREMDKVDVELTISEPDKIAEGRLGRKVYQKIVQDKILLKPMLYRVVVEELENTYSVITVYKISNIKKYM